ncbi:MAG TPA: TlpA disulfide reductase family protein [Verrucomicrobiae bacterium]|nr:TlpA disulfide reductase family protein [Verrucomicrobiae bacterium]
MLRRDKLNHLKWPQGAEEFVAGARALEKDDPKSPLGYELMMEAIDNYEYFHERDKARSLAEKMAQSYTPPRYRAWAEGYLRRSDALGKPISIRFAAVDGKTVDLADMRGKVVLVDFWATGCRPCVAELPALKAVYERLHQRGFEVIGISCDTDKERLLNFTKKNGYSWPEYFDGKLQEDNKFTQQFGIDGIPHMFLVDRQGKLRVDGVRAKGGFETQIEKLLDESQN